MKRLISDMTESEFFEFVAKVYSGKGMAEDDHVEAVLEFKRLAQHPAGSDLLFYPQEGKRGPSAIVEEVKAWRAANGKPGFKSD